MLLVMEDEPVLVDMLVRVDGPVVDMDEEPVLLMAVALVIAAELGEEETDLTVFLDSTTKGAE